MTGGRKPVALALLCAIAAVQVGVRTWPRRPTTHADEPRSAPLSATTAPPRALEPVPLAPDDRAAPDPFRSRARPAAPAVEEPPPAVAAAVDPAASLVITSITLGPHPIAVINGAVVGIGDSIDGFVVRAIAEGSVILEREGVPIAVHR